ncbi:hypothetical protein DNAM5_51 [Haloarcula californiae tailed virus 1]|uniref:Uncharacterized protein n=1 Tax=Haloarcula californiae tailed virus 1 TaxID=1273746 RepID=R4T835_9CAUD|nr:hypothetical protein M202_gp051 [Haloarcula californiae tailed virus 1]AGM11914.1 hypothetical protein DNAM5_51 [Haloarcula californiae tailed virus 1]UBF23038.1 hypothetical protein HCTV-16_gp55 [Haloarcula virus HCTV-16]
MSSFYSEEEKITYDRAGVVVRRFLTRHCDLRETATVVDVCKAMDVDRSNHNQIRIRKAMDYYCPGEREGGPRKRFDLPEEAPEDA